jgi:hypothetical protein
VLFIKKHNSDDLALVIFLRYNSLGKMLQAIGPIASDLPQSIHKYSEEPNLLPKRYRSAIFMTELTTASKLRQSSPSSLYSRRHKTEETSIREKSPEPNQALTKL